VEGSDLPEPGIISLLDQKEYCTVHSLALQVGSLQASMIRIVVSSHDHEPIDSPVDRLAKGRLSGAGYEEIHSQGTCTLNNVAAVKI